MYQYHPIVRFGPWYPLSDAWRFAPAAEGIFQVRLVVGLVDYPRGKSAMVWYQHAPDVQAAAGALAERHPTPLLWCRHLVEIDPGVTLPSFHAQLMTQFVQRFGAAPAIPPPKSSR